MDVRLLVAKVVETVQAEGVAGTIRKISRNLRGQAATDEFDRIHGTDTASIVPLWRLDIGSESSKWGTRYQAIDPENLRAGLGLIGLPAERFTFIDLGSGKGRALIIAAELGFKSVIGVEFATELVDIAKRNLSITKREGIVVVHGDAAAFEFPRGDLVIFLNNPFKQEIVERVAENIGRNIAARPDDAIFVVYVQPDCASVFDGCGFLYRLPDPSKNMGVAVWKAQGCGSVK
jgi:SAM-dependent methyltransferase